MTSVGVLIYLWLVIQYRRKSESEMKTAKRRLVTRVCKFLSVTVLQRVLSILTLGMLAGISSPAQSLQYPPDFRFVEVPNPLSGANPTYPLVAASTPTIGVPFFDSRFATIQTRVTQTRGITGRHEYSRHDPFNVDQTMIVLPSSDGGWNIYRTQTMPFNTTASLVMTFGEMEPRWDPTNPRWLWVLDAFTIVRIDVTSGTRTILKDFATDTSMSAIIAANPVYRITTQDEGEPSQDKRYWAFMLQGNDQAEYHPLYIFTWDRTLNRILGIHHLADNDHAIDWVGMSVLGNYVLIGGDPEMDTGTMTGLMMANRQLTQFHKIAHVTAHSDVGLDSNGTEVIVMQNSQTDHIDLIPIDWATSPVVTFSGYPGSNCVPVVRLFYDNTSPYNFNGGVHISCNYPGYAVVSTTMPPGVAEQNWLDRTIVLVRLDRLHPHVYYLAKLHNTTNLYWEETHGAITNDGRKVVWADNWGQWGQTDGEEKMFLMQLDMPPPSNWTGYFPTAAAHWQAYP